MRTFTEITYEARGHVGIVTIDRPDARHALTHTTDAQLTDVVTPTAPA